MAERIRQRMVDEFNEITGDYEWLAMSERSRN